MVSLGSNIGHWQRGTTNARLNRSNQLLLSLNLESSLRIFFAVLMTTLYAMISFLDWDTGSKPIAGLVADIQDRLVRFGNKRDIDAAINQKKSSIPYCDTLPIFSA